MFKYSTFNHAQLFTKLYLLILKLGSNEYVVFAAEILFL